MQTIRQILKSKKRLFSFLVTLFILGLLLTIVHTISLSEMADEEIEEDMLCDAHIGARLISDRFDGYIKLADQAARELSDVKQIPGKEMCSVLGRYSGNEFGDACYISCDGVIYNEKGSIRPITSEAMAEIRNLKYNTAKLIAGLYPDPKNVVTAVAPVVQGNKRIGYFAGRFSMTDQIAKDVRSYMELDSQMFLTDYDGNIILQTYRGQELSEFSNLVNLKTYLEGQGLNSDGAAMLKKALFGKTEGYSRFEAGDTTYGAAYSHVAVLDNWVYIIIVPANLYMKELMEQRSSEMALLTFNIGLLVVLLLYYTIRAEKREGELEKIAFMDTLTVAKSKAYFRMEAPKLLREERYIKYCVASLDIIGFRYVNELFGHERGNQILKTLARLLNEDLGTKEILARNSADNFELLVADTAQLKQRLILVQDNLNAFAKSIDVSYPLLVRAGVVRGVNKDRERDRDKIASKDISLLLDNANAARKTINSESREMLAEYTTDIQESIKKREKIESSMQAAMEHDEFKVYLQPKIDLKTGKLYGAEALVRWIRVDGTMIYPDEFIPVFEENGFIEKVDFYMLEKVCELLTSYNKKGYRDIAISVNQSRVLFMNPDYVAHVKAVLENHKFLRRNLELEMTETAFFADKGRIIDIMTQLRDMGCKIDIDDFGSGYSSLNLIKDIPFDILKLDREFFGENLTGKGRIILESIVQMAAGLDVECICEGVETVEQEALLCEIGCRYAQGYKYSKPIPADEFEEKYLKK